ncbi:hypothetical protein [Kitasatospora sp. NPDC007106]|uniref:hypothetical protein n=1 Tax=Kitasatospora sp. NPDC007106 TaxID=3156914 RepID=UPI0033D0CB53
MARKRPQHTTFAETVAALPAVPDPGDEEEWGRTGLPGEAAFTDARGRRWHLVRGGLDLRTARRLAVQADVLLVGHWLGDLRDVPADGRQACWQTVKKTLYAAQAPDHAAYEYTSADGTLTMLLLAEYC